MNYPNIRLMHFDVLPTRLGKILGRTPHSRFITENINKIIEQVRQKHNIKENQYDDVMNIEFIIDEFHRVFYGLDYRTKEAYLNKKRYGRGKKPSLQEIKREVIWECLERYYNLLKEKNIHNFTIIRIKFLDQLKEIQEERLFTHIFVDEFQDCTRADFEIFYQLLEKPDNLVIAGDSAQSVHLGTSYSGLTRKADMARRQIFHLESSYRLPYRISECIRKLSKKIIDKHRNRKTDISPNEIMPYKGAPPGARPIVVFAITVDSITKKIKEIFETYQDAYGLKKITILEKDSSLCYALKKMNVNSETDTILRIKGLEKECVLWSVRKSIDNESEAEEIVYTILTRTSSILIIALSEEITDIYKKIIGTLDRERLIFWDQETKDKYSDFCKEPDLEEFFEDIEDLSDN
ncbi:UvrD-helicase domain-containing protein [Aetokthonos hydrillicola]|uniref:UvrD-helicase domain-containing protein n=1 Tax=Aetokthonos hydrillicola TaxID=1550245 RepID=UPI001ABBCE5F